MQLIGSDQFTIIVGLGKTGVSCARYLESRGALFGMVDTREQPPGLETVRREFPGAPLECGPLSEQTLLRASRLLVSPGVSRQEPAIAAAEAAGVEVIGDIDLFCEEVEAPIVAITGSNAKSTVTTLLGEMARDVGWDVAVGGNLGTPVLELLREEPHDLYILELSSFQLETCSRLRAKAATVLNVSPDHMDRYPDLPAYHRAKQRIYQGCEHAVFNLDDPLTQPLIPDGVARTGFRLGRPDLGQFGIIEEAGTRYLAQGLDRLLPVAKVAIKGEHNLANALAALALGRACGLPMASMLATLTRFRGLKHRCQWVRDLDGVAYVNDSKGTNVGATLAAIEGLSATVEGQVVLIAGGEGKGADFSDLRDPLARHGRAAVLIGTDAGRLRDCLQGRLALEQADSMAQAVQKARALAQPGDLVLLSPACASFDMFSGFEARGDAFIEAVEGLSVEAVS
ncbi:UDP-N-acetylmuramoyl-L-alanine--D-glutamate ligase [Motiliproteus sp. SC1-56]|uniref:UDP-N-acetylmuramoyl-L-alanine--D-glutamate ligase n=1 Tax=Motiliproteus sp. SC1-56 TaxID=2799565 RepID=UPI001A9019C7|nr:UDP-N-acetylmuramoyl-L-alanine--D-glutamate ligase [Motiliproteus sp. SC1-56]